MSHCYNNKATSPAQRQTMRNYDMHQGVANYQTPAVSKAQQTAIGRRREIENRQVEQARQDELNWLDD